MKKAAARSCCGFSRQMKSYFLPLAADFLAGAAAFAGLAGAAAFPGLAGADFAAAFLAVAICFSCDPWVFASSALLGNRPSDRTGLATPCGTPPSHAQALCGAIINGNGRIARRGAIFF